MGKIIYLLTQRWRLSQPLKDFRHTKHFQLLKQQRQGINNTSAVPTFKCSCKSPNWNAFRSKNHASRNRTVSLESLGPDGAKALIKCLVSGASDTSVTWKLNQARTAKKRHKTPTARSTFKYTGPVSCSMQHYMSRTRHTVESLLSCFKQL